MATSSSAGALAGTLGSGALRSSQVAENRRELADPGKIRVLGGVYQCGNCELRADFAHGSFPGNHRSVGLP